MGDNTVKVQQSCIPQIQMPLKDVIDKLRIKGFMKGNMPTA